MTLPRQHSGLLASVFLSVWLLNAMDASEGLWLCGSARLLWHAGNFMLLNEDDRSPLKAIDFGLAVLYDPASLPRSDLGLEGTPW